MYSFDINLSRRPQGRRHSSESQLPWFNPRLCAMLFCGAVVFAGGLTKAHATQESLPALATVPGATQLQSASGFSVQTACVGMSTMENLSPASQSLLARCGELVQSAPGAAKDDNTLGLTDQQLNGALQQVASEEAIALGARGGDISTARLGGAITRISQIRRGATGFRVSIANPTSNGSSLAGGVTPEMLAVIGGAAGDGGLASDGKLSGFLNVNYGFGDKDGTDREDGFDFSNWGLTAGLDYRINSEFTIGGLVTYSDLDTDFDTTQYTVSGGSADSDGWGLSAYGLYNHESFYVDGLIGFGRVDYDLQRNVFYTAGPDAKGTSETYNNGVRAFNAKADTNSDDFVASLGVGFDASRDALSYGPYARLSYYKIDIDGYRESGTGATELALAVDDQKVKSLTSSIGARVSYSLSRAFGVVIPYARAEWVHEFDNDARTVGATYIFDPNSTPLDARTNEPDRDYGYIGLGVSSVMPQGYQLFVDYQGVIGFKDLSEHRFIAGLRAEF